MLESYVEKSLRDVFLRYKEVDEVLLFGSRARGDHRYNSDIDLCLFGNSITHKVLANIHMDIEEINTIYSFDILCFNEIKKQELIDNILREGVCIYGKEA
ncbi:MAG: nucleotidyltransferase domain-containing protein [Clostridium sp.]